MKKKKPYVKHIYESLFDADFVIVVSEWEDFLPEVKKIIDKERFEELSKIEIEHGYFSKAKQFPFDGGGSVIWIKPKTGKSTLVHELVHATHHLLKRRDIPLTEETEEVYAYLMDFIYKNCV